MLVELEEPSLKPGLPTPPTPRVCSTPHLAPSPAGEGVGAHRLQPRARDCGSRSGGRTETLTCWHTGVAPAVLSRVTCVASRPRGVVRTPCMLWEPSLPWLFRISCRPNCGNSFGQSVLHNRIQTLLK